MGTNCRLVIVFLVGKLLCNQYLKMYIMIFKNPRGYLTTIGPFFCSKGDFSWDGGGTRTTK